RASSVNLSLEKLAEALDDSLSTKVADRRTEGLDRQTSTEGQPPPKPPHTYYNKHRYPEDGEVQTTAARHDQPSSVPPPPPSSTQDPPASPQAPDDSKDKPKKSVFRKFFTKK
ncbi:hypothetical protein L3Q82_026206, partial [Scortum barcoo]